MMFKAVVMGKNRKGESQHNARLKKKKKKSQEPVLVFSKKVNARLGIIFSMSEVNKKKNKVMIQTFVIMKKM